MNVLLPALVLLVVAPVAAQKLDPVFICRHEMMTDIFLVKGVYFAFSDLVIDESTGNFIVPNSTALETFTDLCKSEPDRGSVIEASKYYGTDFMCDGRSGFSNIPLCVADSWNNEETEIMLSLFLPSILPSVRNLGGCLDCYTDMSNIFESDVYSDFESSVFISQIGGNFTVNGDALVTFTKRCVSEAGSIEYGYGCDDWFPGLSSDSIPLCVADSCSDEEAKNILRTFLLPHVLGLDEGSNVDDADWWCHDDAGSLDGPPPSGAPSSSSGPSSKSTKGSKASKSSKQGKSSKSEDSSWEY